MTTPSAIATPPGTRPAAAIPSVYRPDLIALCLRVGLGAVFLIGGINKLAKLLDPATEAALVAKYMSPAGYINTFFTEWMFDGRFGDFLTPWSFLTALSAFELVAGAALIAGVFVRPFALILGLMLWSFVFSLPVVTSPNVTVTVDTYMAPAMFVQIRDIGLSGIAFSLWVLGVGAYAADSRLFKVPAARTPVDWDSLGLLLRMSVAFPLLVGGVFVGMPDIQSFQTPGAILVVLGVLITAGVGVRLAGVGVALVMLWYMGTKLNFDASLIANLNAFKRELAFLAAGVVLAGVGGGNRFAVSTVLDRLWGRPAAVTPVAAES